MREEVLEILNDLMKENSWDLASAIYSGISNNKEKFDKKKLDSILKIMKIGGKLTKDENKRKNIENAFNKLKSIRDIEENEKQKELVSLDNLLNEF